MLGLMTLFLKCVLNVQLCVFLLFRDWGQAGGAVIWKAFGVNRCHQSVAVKRRELICFINALMWPLQSDKHFPVEHSCPRALKWWGWVRRTVTRVQQCLPKGITLISEMKQCNYVLYFKGFSGRAETFLHTEECRSYGTTGCNLTNCVTLIMHCIQFPVQIQHCLNFVLGGACVQACSQIHLSWHNLTFSGSFITNNVLQVWMTGCLEHYQNTMSFLYIHLLLLYPVLPLILITCTTIRFGLQNFLLLFTLTISYHSYTIFHFELWACDWCQLPLPVLTWKRRAQIRNPFLMS